MGTGRPIGRDHELENALAAWLADGPELAPMVAVEDAIDAVGQRPRRPWDRWQARWRDAREAVLPGEPARRLAWVAVVAAALLLAFAWAALVLSSRPTPRPLPAPMNGLLAVAVGGQLVIVDPNGRRMDVVEADGEEWTDPAWSPDATSLAVRVHDVAGGAYRVDLLATDGTLQRTILGPVEWIAPGLAWSPEGEWVATATGVRGAESIVLARADGRELRPLIGATGTRPAFDPTGEWVAFVGRDASGTAGLLVTGLDAADRPRFLVTSGDPSNVSTPAWMSDGRSLVVQVPGEDLGAATSALLSVSVADGRAVTLRADGGAPGSSPLVLPDGRVALMSETGVDLVDPATGEVVPADPTSASGQIRPMAMTVAPDGQRVAVLIPAVCDGSTCRPGRLVTLPTAPDGVVHRVAGSLNEPASDPTGWSIAWQPLARPDGRLEATDVQSCAVQDGGSPSGSVGHERYDGVVLVCSAQASDARVSGTFTLTMTIQMAPDDSATLVGTSELANADGTWIGEFSGTVAPGYTDHDVRATLLGTGAFAGLRARLHVTGPGGDRFRSETIIEPVAR